MNWQKRARIGVAAVGIATAIGVFAVMGERAKPAPAAAPARIDPKAMIESQGNILQQVRGTTQDYVIEAAQQLTYEGGATKLIGVKISIKNRGGRDYLITAQEAQAGERQQDLRLTGMVTLAASDGFSIATEEALFTEADSTVRAPGAFTFARGRMSGTGTGMSYDQTNDILTISGQAAVKITDEGDNTLTQFEAGSAIFTRPNHLLSMEGMVHVLHNDQVIDAQQAAARLAEDDSNVEYIELRGGAEVKGSAQGLESMSGEAIDLEYAPDSTNLQRIEMNGSGRVSIAGGEATAARQIAGQWLELMLAPDGSITTIQGRDGVELAIAATGQQAARTVKARTLEGTGAEGQGLQSARFRENVEFREVKGGDGRTVRARALDVKMAQDAFESALFNGNVRFEERGLQASGGEALYDPAKGTLRLTAGQDRSVQRVADEQVTVDAAAIDITIQGRAMTANGQVKSTLRARPQNNDGKLPNLLRQEQPVNVSGDRFSYAGAAGKAVYDGNAALLQGDTAIRADQIAIDQSAGDLTATGDARSTLVFDSGRSIGRAARINYTDAKRLIAYEGVAGKPAARGQRAVPGSPAQLGGPQGDLRATRIELVLAQQGSRLDRLEAYDEVSLKVDTRTATGARLTYFAADERYVMTGGGTIPVMVVESCRRTTGKTLTFYKSVDRIVIDGNEQIRTQTTSGGACADVPATAR